VKLVTAGEKGAKFGKESVRSRLIGEIAIETARGIETAKENAIVPRRGDLVPETEIASGANDRAVGTGNAPVAVKIGWTRQWPNRKVMRPSLRATNAGEIKNEIKTRIDESAVIVIKIVVKIERRIATRTRIVSGNDHAAVVIARVNDVIGIRRENAGISRHVKKVANKFVSKKSPLMSMNSMPLRSMTSIITMTPIISSMKRVNPISRRKNTNTDNEEVANCV